jgi:hypothetical protein
MFTGIFGKILAKHSWPKNAGKRAERRNHGMTMNGIFGGWAHTEAPWKHTIRI